MITFNLKKNIFIAQSACTSMGPWIKKRFRIVAWPVNVEDDVEYNLNGDIVLNSEKHVKKSHRNHQYQ